MVQYVFGLSIDSSRATIRLGWVVVWNCQDGACLANHKITRIFTGEYEGIKYKL